ncbi:patatin-domain-containing protein [Bimuria novae-zelandiae CBS 107.79]|uniref:Patatin-like phospholipase domain-containing protein n=1 Tax=Bimuria novae-zelandiae CBS 107.79 TaxID=1447943 RepID=A0A6A5VLV7_9PLEO|nr:patatin-domain-containing protein [Bimuria novae-zelandiae CBS 107.79]
MSFVYDTVLFGGARLHTARGGQQGKDVAKQPSQSQGGRLNPLIRLVQDPFGVLGRGTKDAESTPPENHEKARKQLLYLRMREATSYEEWKTAASELDTLEGNDAWKLEDESSEYDAELVKARLEQLDDARLNCDVQRMLFLVRTTLTRGIGGMGDLRLYKHSHVGTKKLIERYIESAVRTLHALPDVAAKQGESCPVKPHKVAEELLRTRQSFGRTALLLSGGGTFGMNHIGVVKCLWELRLLPRIISGASAGSIVCAVLCSKTDAEIPAVLAEFCYGDLAVFEKPGDEEGVIQKVTRFLKFGSLFDISHLQRVMRQMLGDITFQESYNRTRRILNITVSSASMYELPRLLNYVTAPDVMIWSAVCASCSVPFVFSAASLMAKDHKTGRQVPWDPTPNEGWIDGSVDNDLPMTRLAEMFNVNHFIVSQVNPHVVPFLAKEEEAISADVHQNNTFSAGPGWINNMANFAKGEALHRLEVLAEMGVFPNTMSKVRSILNQRYSGDITIFPVISYTNFPKILSNPTTDFMLRCLLTGEQATWTKVSRIQNHLAIELALDEAVNHILPCVHFSQRQANLRLLNLTRPAFQGSDLPPTHPLRRHKRDAQSESLGAPLAPFTPFIETSAPDFPLRPSSQGKGLTPTVSRPYLPSRPSMRPPHSPDVIKPHFATVEAVSSTDAEDDPTDADVSDNVDSDTSAILSSPEPVHSPPLLPRAPDLWQSTGQIVFPYPSISHPHLHTPFDDGRGAVRASAMPSSPELRYKRLFHPPVEGAKMAGLGKTVELEEGEGSYFR